MMSACTLANLDPATQREFRVWRRAFERQRQQRPNLQRNFSRLIEAGCDPNDLEWALYWVALNLHLSKGSREGLAELAQFFVLVGGTIPKIIDLREQIDSLLAWPPQTSWPPGFYLYTSLIAGLAPHVKVPQLRDRIRHLPRILLELELLLKAIQGFRVTVQMAASAARVTEVMLIEYVRKATRTRVSIDELLDQISAPMHLANKVYKANVREYEWETWARRYRHFKQQEKEKYRAITAIIEEFLARKSKGEPVDLIPFFNHFFLIQARSWMVDSKQVGR